MRRFYWLLLGMGLLMMVSGCTTTRNIPLDEQASLTSQIEPGQSVEITLKNGETFRLRVLEVHADAIVGEEQTVRIDDIASIGKVRLHPGRTFGAVLGGFMVAVYGVIFIFLLGVLA